MNSAPMACAAQLDASKPWVPIARPALRQEVSARIRQMIEDGTLLPGCRIPERQLCARLGVSRTPLREAFRVLHAEGLLEIEPRRGATVKRMQPGDLDHMFQVLEVLEGLAGELACTLISDHELYQIEALHRRMISAYKARSRRRFFKINQEIHERIVKASGNAILIQVYEGLSGQVRRIRYMPVITEAQWIIALDQHEGIMRALKARNRRVLGKILRDHVKMKRERAKVLLAL